jgi:hypothetical protein
MGERRENRIKPIADEGQRRRHEEACDQAGSERLADRILLWSYSDTDAYTLESCDWYSADSFGHLFVSASQVIESQLSLLNGEFWEFLNLAEFLDIEEQLQPSEVAVFLKAAGAPDDADFRSIDGYDCFSGLGAVIRCRLNQRSLEQIKLAAGLFNWTVEFGLFSCDTNAHFALSVGSVEEVAPFLLERILNRLQNDAKQEDPECQALPSTFEQRFHPLAPVLTMLKETVESADWVQNQLALRIFFWIAEMYKVEVENEAS